MSAGVVTDLVRPGDASGSPPVGARLQAEVESTLERDNADFLAIRDACALLGELPSTGPLSTMHNATVRRARNLLLDRLLTEPRDFAALDRALDEADDEDLAC